MNASLQNSECNVEAWEPVVDFVLLLLRSEKNTMSQNRRLRGQGVKRLNKFSLFPLSVQDGCLAGCPPAKLSFWVSEGHVKKSVSTLHDVQGRGLLETLEVYSCFPCCLSPTLLLSLVSSTHPSIQKHSNKNYEIQRQASKHFS